MDLQDASEALTIPIDLACFGSEGQLGWNLWPLPLPGGPIEEVCDNIDRRRPHRLALAESTGGEIATFG